MARQRSQNFNENKNFSETMVRQHNSSVRAAVAQEVKLADA